MRFIKSLWIKVLLSALLPGLLMFGLVTQIALSSYERVARDVVEQRDSELARITAARLAEAIAPQVRLLESATFNSDVQSLDPTSIDTALAILEQDLFIFDAGVAVLNISGALVSHHPAHLDRREFPLPLQDSFFTQVEATQSTVFSNVIVDPASSKSVVVIGAPIVRNGDQVVGVLVGASDIKASLIGATLSAGLGRQAGRDSDAFLVDSQGTLIYHRDPSLVGANAFDLEPVARVTRGLTGAMFIEDPEGREVITGYSPVVGAGWGVVTQEPWATIAQPIRWTSRMVLAILIFGGLLVTALIAFFMMRVLLPIRQLTYGARRIVEGDFDYQIDARSGDEIEALADQFNRMAAALKESYEGLEQQVATRTQELQDSEERLRAVIDDLQRSNSDLEQFAYVASHDLQEPLRAIVGFTNLLARRYEGKLDDQADMFIQRTVKAAQRMQTLINDLLAYSRIGRGDLRMERTDTAFVVRQTLEDLQPAITEAGAVVTTEDLPTIWANGFMLGQVFTNLIANAVKFSEKDHPQVRVRAEKRDNEWLFAVQDNGIGIEPQYIERIFVIFQRLHVRTEYEGTGIGLAICKKAVERLGGRIWVESEPGEGSTFFFTIPMQGDGPLARQTRRLRAADAEQVPGAPDA